MQIGFWIRDPEAGSLPIRSEIARSVLKRFQEEGIEIPAPQRDVRITSVSGAMPLVAATGASATAAGET